MEIVVLFAEKWHISPFDVLQKDIDDFILIANYMVQLGDKNETPRRTHQEERIRVNDETATGGWF